MSKKIGFKLKTSWLHVALLLCCILVLGLAQPAWALDGSGTAEEPYLIKSAEDLYQMRDTAYLTGGKHFRLETDLDLSQTAYDGEFDEGRGWEPIGTKESPFTGIFDGGGKTISNLTINRLEDENVGLFGYVDNATLTDLNLKGVAIKGAQSVGSLVGYTFKSDISGIYIAPGSRVTGKVNVGGLVGFIDSGAISDSHIGADVIGMGEGESGGDIGGLAGKTRYGTITNCYATGAVTGTFCVGGLVGHNWGGEITLSRAEGTVKGERDTGELVGFGGGSITLTIGSLKAVMDGESHTLDAPPYIKTGVNRVLMPIRLMSDGMGVKVDWRESFGQVFLKDAEKEIVLTIGSKEALVNGEIKTLDCPPEVVPPGRTFVPLRFVIEALGARVDYEDSTKEITITVLPQKVRVTN
jgi:hypothetical protein